MQLETIHWKETYIGDIIFLPSKKLNGENTTVGPYVVDIGTDASTDEWKKGLRNPGCIRLFIHDFELVFRQKN